MITENKNIVKSGKKGDFYVRYFIDGLGYCFGSSEYYSDSADFEIVEEGEVMTIKEMRLAAGMTQKEFSEYFGIPKRNIESWEAGIRQCTPYLLDLIEYKLRNEKMIGQGE